MNAQLFRFGLRRKAIRALVSLWFGPRYFLATLPGSFLSPFGFSLVVALFTPHIPTR